TSRLNGLPHGASRVGILGRCVEERAPTPPSGDDSLADALHDSHDHRARRLLWKGRNGVPSKPVQFLDIDEDKIILRREVIVECRLSYARFRDDAVDAHGTDAPHVTQNING